MAELKTKKTTASVTEFIKSIADADQRKDAKALVKMMREASGARPKMWGAAIVGFGDYHYTYASGRSGDWFRVGFSPRKRDLTLYIMPGFAKAKRLLTKLGPHKTGKSCLYIKRLADVDTEVLRQLIDGSLAEMKKKYG